MIDFSYSCPTNIVFTKGGFEVKLKEVLSQTKVDKVLLVYGGQSAIKTGVLDKVLLALEQSGVKSVKLGGVKPNPELSKVEEGVTLAKNESVDMILALGGGSIIDTAKAIAFGALLKENESIWEYFQYYQVPKEALKIGVILTIPASGSEASDATVISHNNQKLLCSSPVLMPQFAILDPTLTLTLSPYQTACGLADILSHLQERYFTNEANNELSNRLLEACMLTIVDESYKVLKTPTNIDSRSEIMWTATLAHNAIFDRGRNGGDWACHMIEHALSAKYNITHAEGLACITPAWMRYVSMKNDFTKNMFLNLSAHLWKTDDIQKAINLQENWYKTLGLKTKLRELNINKEDIESLVKEYFTDDYPLGLLYPLKTSDIVEIIKLAW